MAKTAKAASEALPEPETLTFEEALDELESLTAAMATGTTTLLESVAAYERGTKLLARCRNELADARATIERLRETEEGGVERRPLDNEDED